jgi:hypothetical protein
LVRTHWHDLPARVRTAVGDRIGPITAAGSASAGRNSEIAATLDTPSGKVFVKGMRTDLHPDNMLTDGHTVRSPRWRAASTEAVDAFTTANSRLWDEIATADPQPWKQRIAAAAQEWSQHRLHGPH